MTSLRPCKSEGSRRQSRNAVAIALNGPGRAAVDPRSVRPALPTIRYATVGHVLVLVHGTTAPTAHEWLEYCATLKEAGTRPDTTLLVITGDAGPTPKQREELQRSAPPDIRVAVVTGSPLARGIVTLLGWFNATIRAFTPAELTAAVTYLGVTESETPLVLERVAAMRAELSMEIDGAASAEGYASAIASMDRAVARLEALSRRSPNRTSSSG